MHKTLVRILWQTSQSILQVDPNRIRNQRLPLVHAQLGLLLRERGCRLHDAPSKGAHVIVHFLDATKDFVANGARLFKRGIQIAKATEFAKIDQLLLIVLVLVQFLFLFRLFRASAGFARVPAAPLGRWQHPARTFALARTNQGHILRRISKVLIQMLRHALVGRLSLATRLALSTRVKQLDIMNRRNV